MRHWETSGYDLFVRSTWVKTAMTMKTTMKAWVAMETVKQAEFKNASLGLLVTKSVSLKTS